MIRYGLVNSNSTLGKDHNMPGLRELMGRDVGIGNVVKSRDRFPARMRLLAMPLCWVAAE